MNCDEARALIDQGVTPGSTQPLRAALGFHLVGCAECRAYYAARDQRFLEGLLGATAAQPAGASVIGAETLRDLPSLNHADTLPVQPEYADETDEHLSVDPPSGSHRRLIRYGVFAAVLVVLLGVVFVLGRSAYAVYTIRSNVQAMQLPSPPPTSNAPRPSRVPTLVVPSAIAHAVIPATRTVAPATAVRPTASARPEQPSAPAAASATPAPATITPELLPVPALAGEQVAPRGTPVTVPIPASGQALNILLLGIDRRPDEQGGSRSDAIIIAHLDPDRKRIALLSLPRDLVVDIPGYGYGRINAASVYGDLYPELGGGVALSRKTVSNLLGIPINYVVRVDFNGFIGVIDALGGIDINVEKELYDPEYPTMDYGYMEAHFLPGPQHMDGQMALIYARIRHMDSDFERMRRQQSVIMAAGQRLKQQNALEQLQSVAAITTAMRNYIETDLPEDTMAGLAWTFRNVSPDSVERYALDGSQVQMGVYADDPYAEYALPGAIEGLVQQLVNGPQAQ